MGLDFLFGHKSIAACIWVFFLRGILRKALWVSDIVHNLDHVFRWFDKLLWYFFLDTFSSHHITITWRFFRYGCLLHLLYSDDWVNVLRSVLRLSCLLSDPFWSVNLLVHKLSKGKERRLRNLSIWSLTHHQWEPSTFVIFYHWISNRNLVLLRDIKNVF